MRIHTIASDGSSANKKETFLLEETVIQQHKLTGTFTYSEARIKTRTSLMTCTE